jgi:hypothetical protein
VSGEFDTNVHAVPELAFNKLKFLRDPGEHQDEHAPNGPGRKPSNLDKKRGIECEEISACFG